MDNRADSSSSTALIDEYGDWLHSIEDYIEGIADSIQIFDDDPDKEYIEDAIQDCEAASNSFSEMGIKLKEKLKSLD